MKVTFVHHSCFCVEIENKVFIFDYFQGERIEEFSFQGRLPEFSKEQDVYVFSSHQHRDHFDLDIFSWQEKYPGIQYILAKDIRLGDNYLARNGIDPKVKERIHFLKGNASLELEGLVIETLPSTDEGVAFLVSYQGKTIYHAGDLHWWHWEGEEEIFNQYQEKTYKRQIDKLAGRQIDVAFVVIDQRLYDAQFWGIQYFMEHVQAEHVVPMHLWQNYGLVQKFKSLPQAAPYRESIVDITGENQVLEWE